VLAVLLLSAPAWSSHAQEPVPVTAFTGQTHIHGLAFDRGNPGYLFIATHHGLFRAGPDATATQISVVQDFMGFTPHPTEPQILFASGHPPGGGNLGFIVSADGGETWVQRSLGVGGPADFHQLAVSPVDPEMIYGVFGLLQVSTDGGANWAVAGRVLPPQIVDLAASAVSTQTVYAAAEGGLYVTTDGGATWRPLIRGAPVSLVEIAPDGSLYVFVLGQGLLRAPDELSDLAPVGGDWVEPYLFHLSVDPSDPNHMFAATAAGRILVSFDGGRSWATFGA
jgi:photosystem II stability/assembly factor-like uncharacterized protein